MLTAVALLLSAVADPVQAVALIGLGIRVLSLAPGSIPQVKNAVRSVEMTSLTDLMSRALKLSSASEVKELLEKELPRQAPLFFSALATKTS